MSSHCEEPKEPWVEHRLSRPVSDTFVLVTA
jgi:hypothetical protein